MIRNLLLIQYRNICSLLQKMDQEPKFYFTDYFQNDPNNLAAYFQDAYSLILIEADRKGIEFDGYLAEKWEESADSVFHFDEEYFEDFNRKKLYVYLSALYDEEIFSYLCDAYVVASQGIPTKKEIKKRIEQLISAGVNFDFPD